MPIKIAVVMSRSYQLASLSDKMVFIVCTLEVDIHCVLSLF